MNCHEFENLVVDLARGEVTDSSVGTRCWAHAANCPRCADQLLDQEKLTAGLEAVTTRTDAMRAPERIEARLRREFRDRFAKSEGLATSRPSSWNSPQQTWMNISRAAWAVAASIFLVGLAGIMTAGYRTKLATVNTAKNVVTPKPAEPPVTAANINPPAPTVSRSHSAANGVVENQVSKSHERARVVNGQGAAPRPTFQSISQGELATNFYPLPYGSGLPLDEGWEIVRVNLPRSALATLGVPLTGELSSSDTIKADLVLGEDGLARAIRFVE